MADQTMEQVFNEGLKPYGVKAEILEEERKFGLNLIQNDRVIGFVWWDVIEFDFTFNHIVVQFWCDDPITGKTLETVYNDPTKLVDKIVAHFNLR